LVYPAVSVQRRGQSRARARTSARVIK